MQFVGKAKSPFYRYETLPYGLNSFARMITYSRNVGSDQCVGEALLSLIDLILAYNIKLQPELLFHMNLAWTMVFRTTESKDHRELKLDEQGDDETLFKRREAIKNTSKRLCPDFETDTQATVFGTRHQSDFGLKNESTIWMNSQ